MWFEYFWGFIAQLLLPFIWPIFFLILLIFGVNYSSSKLSEKKKQLSILHLQEGAKVG